MKAKKQIPVIFRKYNDGQIIALFPFEPWDKLTCSSYMHIGQHSGAGYNWVISTTKPARSTDYAQLLKELHQIGYRNLRIMQKRPTNCPTCWPNL